MIGARLGFGGGGGGGRGGGITYNVRSRGGKICV